MRIGYVSDGNRIRIGYVSDSNRIRIAYESDTYRIRIRYQPVCGTCRVGGNVDSNNCRVHTSTGLLHALVPMDLPGPGSVFLSQQWKFTAPVYIGDTITAKAEVLSVHATKPVTQLKINVVRQTGETVLEGEAWCYTMGA